MSKYLFITACFMAVINLTAQELPGEQENLSLLTLDSAINAALEENHDVIIAKKETQIAQNNTFIGNAGLLPSLTANGGYNWNLKNTNIQFVTPAQEPINRQNAKSESISGSVMLEYNLFSGLSKFYRLESLEQMVRLSDEETKLTIENTIFAVIQRYLEIARISRELDIAGEALNITDERLQRAQSKFELGSMSKIQVLNAKVDLNADSLNYAQTLQELSKAKRNLKVIMGKNPDAEFRVETEFAIDPSLEEDSILDKAMQNNTNLILANIRRDQRQVQEKINRGGLYPQVNGSFGYEYLKQTNEAGFVTSQENYGWTGGIQLSVPIFNGNQQRIQIENAMVDLSVSNQQREKAKLEVKKEVLNAFTDYQSILYQLDLTEDDLRLAELNLERSEENWDLGQISGTDLRTAELNYIRTANRINTIIIQAKLAEMRLLKLAGSLGEQQGN